MRSGAPLIWVVGDALPIVVTAVAWHPLSRAKWEWGGCGGAGLHELLSKG